MLNGEFAINFLIRTNIIITNEDWLSDVWYFINNFKIKPLFGNIFYLF